MALESGRSTGVKCKCGGYIRYQRTENDRVRLHCNKCGWEVEQNERWNPERHGRVETPKPQGNNPGAVVIWLIIIGAIIALWLGSQTNGNQHAANYNSTPTSSQSKTQPIERAMFTMRVTAPQELNVRSGPSPRFDVVKKLYSNDIVAVYRTENGWSHIGTGWVNSKFLTNAEYEGE